MMKKALYLFLLSFAFIPVFAQTLNIDSLKKELVNYTQIKSSNQWNAYTIKYLNEDSLVVFEIPYNSAGEIDKDIWGLAFYYNKYDANGCPIEKRYYDVNGKLHFTDWPPVIKITYDDQGRKIRQDYFGEDEKRVGNKMYAVKPC